MTDDRRHERTRRRHFALAAGLAATLAAGCSGRGSGDAAALGNRAGAATGTPRPVRRIPVEVAAVRKRAVEYTIDTVGSLLASEIVHVPARVPGVVQDVRFHEGDRVQASTVLARIDPVRYQLVAARATATFQEAEARKRDSEAGLGMRRSLREKEAGWVSESELITLEAKLDQAKASSAQAQAQMDLAKKDIEDSSVRAPIAGVIDQKHADTGHYVSVGQAIATIVDRSRLKLSFKVAESESVRLAPGMDVAFAIRPLPGRSFTARLFHIGETADPASRQIECLAWVDHPDPLLRPGFFANVTLAVGHQESVVVAETAVLPTDKGFVAYVLRAGTPDQVEQRVLKLGMRTRTAEIEVLEGLAPGETVVVRGSAMLSDGAFVTTVPGDAISRTPAAATKAGDGR